jgi:hypothetical protein
MTALVGFDPFENSRTLASLSLNYWRSKFLPENTVPLISFDSYRRTERQSIEALKLIYLVGQCFKNCTAVERKFMHARSSNEYKVGKFKVDLVVLENERIVFALDAQGGPKVRGH